MGLFDLFYGKSLDKEVNKMMGQCDGFLIFAITASENIKGLLPILQEKKKTLDKIILTYRSNKGKLDGQSFLVLKKLKEECSKIYNENFNYTEKTFDDEYTPIRFKI